jgi:hypothetical protein
VDERDVRKFLEAVKRGSLPVESAIEQLRQWPYEDLGFAKIDHHRALRQGFPEVIFARKKTAKQVAEIARGMLRAKASHNILITRADKKIFTAVKKLARAARFHELSGAITISRSTANHGKGLILVVTAGTSDIPVAEEALVTAQIMGRGRGRAAPAARASEEIGGGACDYLRGGNGRGAAERRGGARGGAADRGPDEHGIRIEFRRIDRPAGDVE